LFTKIKSPAKSVGIIEPEGILNGSAIKDRIKNTKKITGKKLLEYSTRRGSFAFADLFLLKTKISKSQMKPVIDKTITIIKANIIFLPPLK
jgi:hypothetical protein